MTRIKNKTIAVKILLVVALIGTLGYFVPTLPTFAQAPLSPQSVSPIDKAIQDERNKAVEMARNGKYDQALTSLGKLHERYPQVEPITRDYLAVLGWAGHDEEAVHLYETIPAQQPDYVLSAVGHSYRVLHQSEQALAVYRLGLQTYPDSVIFADGEIRCLADEGKLEEAEARADEDLRLHGNRAEIVADKADIVQALIKAAHDKAVDLARNQNYSESIALFCGDLLDADHTTDPSIRRDYLAVLGWSGGHDQQVISIYQSLKDGDQPDYVLEAVAKAYRNQRQPEKALAIYRQGLRQYPDSAIFAMGEIRCLVDLGRTDEVSRKIGAYETLHGRTPELDLVRRDIAQARLNAARRKAVLLARQGQYEQALDMLRKLDGAHTRNIGILQDRLAITGWMGGHDADVVAQYQALNNPNQPDYVLEATGKAYRNLGKTDEALAVYEHGLARYPDNEIFAVGTIRSLTDAGYIEKALTIANENLRRCGNRLEVLLAAADAANQYNQNDALRFYQIAATVATKNPDVLRGLIRTSDRLGAPGIALKTIEENPGIVSDVERRQIEGDEVASFVRLGMLEDSENKGGVRFAGTDRALSRLDSRIAQWQNEGPDAQINILRARFDRIIALHNRLRMQDVLNEYNRLMAEGVTIPIFVLGAVGDAYLDLHQPEKARDILLKLVEIEPKNNLARRQLFYAYVDLGEYRNAYRIADEMVRDGTVWNRQKNETVPMTDAEHRDAELTAGAARLYFGEVGEADMRLLPVIASSPDVPSVREAAGNLANAHRWPQQALREYQTGLTLAGGKNLSNEVGIANTQLALHNYREAEAEVQSLMERYPENQSVLRANRDWRVHNMAEFDLNAGYYFEPMTSHNVSGGQAYGIDAKIYSSPFHYNWRLFAGEFFTHQKEPSNEGSVGLSRSTVGVEYRNGPITANVAPTYNSYHGTERVGVAADISSAINDHWTVVDSGELFSRETPLRALNKGVTADLVNAHAVWQQDETRSARFGVTVMPFSDGNMRTGLDGDFTQRMLTRPYWKVDGMATAGFDHNSANENRSYFNPSSDFIGLIGARIIQTLYQRYATLWQHSLQVMPGAYWQSHYGADPALRARYEQRIFLNETFEAGLGLNFLRQDYDGAAENDFSLTLDLVDHF